MKRWNPFKRPGKCPSRLLCLLPLLGLSIQDAAFAQTLTQLLPPALNAELPEGLASSIWAGIYPRFYSVGNTLADPALGSGLLGVMGLLLGTIALWRWSTHRAFTRWQQIQAELQQAQAALQQERRDRQRLEAALQESSTQLSLALAAAEAGISAELQQTRQFLQTVIDHLPVAIFVKDGRAEHFGEMLLWNHTSEQMFGLTAEQAIGKTVADFFPPEQADFFLQKDREAFERGTPTDIPEEPVDSHSLGRRILHTVKVPLYDRQQQPEYLLCFSEDITERKLTEDAVRESERRLATLISNLPGYVYRVANDPNYPPEFISEGVFAVTGYRQEEYLVDGTISCGQEIHPADAEAIGKIVQQAVAAQQPYECEYRILTKSGEQKWVWERGRGVYAETGQLIRLEGFVTDISDRKQIAAVLQQREELYRQLAEDMPALICTFLPDSTLTYVNSTYCQYFNQRSEELLGTRFLDFLPDEAERQFVQAQYMALTPQTPSAMYVHPVVQGDGSEGWLQWVDHAFFDEQGQITRLQSIGLDVSDRRLAETKLQEQQARLKLALEVANMGIWEGNLLTGEEILSPQAEAILGFAPGTFDGRQASFLDRVHPEDLALVRQCSQAAMQTGSLRAEYRIVLPDHTIRWIYCLGRVFYDEGGQPNRIVGVDLDITERKQAEADLRDSEERWQFALEGPGDGVWDWNAETNTVFYSRQWKAMLGYAEPEVGNTLEAWDSRVHPDDKAACYADLQKHFRGEIPIYQNEHRLRCKDGSYKWILARGKVMEWLSEGQPRRIIGTHTDVSDRKRAEEALRQSINTNQVLLSAIPDLILRISRQGIYQAGIPKPEVPLLLGVEEQIGKSLWEVLPLELAQQRMEAIEQAFQTGLTQIHEYPICINGEWRYEEARCVVCGEDEAMVLVRDISDRKRAEQELRESEARFRQLAENIQEVFWMADIEFSTIFYVSPAYEATWGRPCASLYEQPFSFVEAIHPEDRAHALTVMQQQRHQGWDQEYRILQPNGTLRWIWEQAFPVTDAEGQIQRIVGICQDISDRKQAEQQLQNLVEATAATTGQNFFPALVSHMAKALNVAYALVTEEVDGKLKALAFWAHGALQPTFSYHPAKTPCEWALRDGKFYCESFVQQLFPQDLDLVQMGAESYLGLALRDRQGRAIGNLCILDTQPIRQPLQAENLLRVFAARAAAELERERAAQALEQLNRELEAIVDQRTAALTLRTAQLEASNRELESFSYSVSHDLRAPLRHIHGFVNALKQKLESHQALTDPKVVHYLQVIENSSQKMAQLIDGLLTLSRLGRKPIAYESVPLRDLVDEAIALVQTQAASTSVEFILGELPTVQGDATLLQQVLSNLISNAVKFSRNHSAPRIEIGILPEGTIFVRDNGVGFQMEYADKLFGAFQRLHAQTEFEGTGIGLAIVQRIIHRHGGSIWAESQLNQGATFYFTLGALVIDRDRIQNKA